MAEEVPIREYEQAVYIYWFGPNLSSVKIGHTSDPERRLIQLGSDTGVPDHLASYAAIVWVDRKRERVEALAHQLAEASRRSGEWFDLTAVSALEYILEAVRQLGVRFEVEDRAGIYECAPKTFHEAHQRYQDTRLAVTGAQTRLSEAEEELELSAIDDDIAIRNRLSDQVRSSKAALGAAILRHGRAKAVYLDRLEEYKKTPEYAEEMRLRAERDRLAAERSRIEEAERNARAIAYWNKRWGKD